MPTLHELSASYSAGDRTRFTVGATEAYSELSAYDEGEDESSEMTGHEYCSPSPHSDMNISLDTACSARIGMFSMPYACCSESEQGVRVGRHPRQAGRQTHTHTRVRVCLGGRAGGRAGGRFH